MDEEVARDFILFGQPDVTIVVVDATRLERNLNLALQVLEITDRVVVCLNLMDEARRHGIEVDERALARRLGVPVVPTAARYREGLNELIAAVADVATGRTVCKPRRLHSEPPGLKHAVTTLTGQIRQMYPDLPNAALGGAAAVGRRRTHRRSAAERRTGRPDPAATPKRLRSRTPQANRLKLNWSRSDERQPL